MPHFGLCENSSCGKLGFGGVELACIRPQGIDLPPSSGPRKALPHGIRDTVIVKRDDGDAPKTSHRVLDLGKASSPPPWRFNEKRSLSKDAREGLGSAWALILIPRRTLGCARTLKATMAEARLVAAKKFPCTLGCARKEASFALQVSPGLAPGGC